MIAGVTGRLLAEAHLEDLIEPGVPPRSGAPDLSIAAEASRAVRRWRRQCAMLGPASSLRALAEVGLEPLAQLLGFRTTASIVAFGTSGLVELQIEAVRVPCLVRPWADRLDALWREATIAGERMGSRWIFVFNGIQLRIADGSRPLANRWIDFDLDTVADDPRSFVALWTTARAEVFLPRHATGVAGFDVLVESSDAFAAGVCRSLRDGVLTASNDVLGALVVRRPSSMQAAFEQALTVVYRVLFLLFAESRGLVPTWHPIYRESYSMDALRGAAERGRAVGLWDGLRAVGRLASAGCRAGDLTVTAFNGRLFDPSRAPLAERRNLDDEAASRAVLALTTRRSPERGGRERIAYRDLGVEQLGAVYETLLDYEPSPGSAALRSTARLARKASGSFYTPQPIAQWIVRHTLAPLVRDRDPEAVLSLRVLDPSMGSGAFLVAACEFLAVAYAEALVTAGRCLPGDIGPEDRAAFRRVVAERCLFGVDSNPMAVQLARLSLWLATLARDRPLSFLDHHIRVGDSLVGAWVSSLARPPRRAARRGAPEQAPQRTAPLFGDEPFRPAVSSALPIRFMLNGPNDTVADVRAKERALAALERPGSTLAGWRRVADLWCAHWFAGTEAPPASAYGTLADHVLSGRGDLPVHLAERHLAHVAEVAMARRFFHWELEYPEVFFDAQGQRLPTSGFDAIIGNPPWDMVRGDWGPAAERARARVENDRLLRFTREAGVYDTRAEGHANRYQLFVERGVALLCHGGRLGLVLPGGWATDQGSASIRRLVFSQCAVDGLVGFENRKAIFPIHRSVRFLLLTATKGASTRRLGLRFGELDVNDLERQSPQVENRYPVQVTPELLERVTGPELAVPQFRGPVELSIAERAATAFPPLGSVEGWAVHFGRELNATDDRGMFLQSQRGLPVVDGKHLHPFRVEVDASERRVDAATARRRLAGRHERPRLAYRDVASATNRVTLIAAILPRGCVSTHTLFCLRTPLPLQAQFFLCGLFNSLTINFLVRLRVTTHVTTSIVERLPIPRRAQAPTAFRELAALAHGLTRVGDENDRARGRAQLDAQVAALYGLSRDEFAYVLDTFPLIERRDRDRALALHRDVA